MLPRDPPPGRGVFLSYRRALRSILFLFVQIAPPGFMETPIYEFNTA